MLDEFSMHVYNIKAAVEPSADLDRPEPQLGRREEFDVLLIGRSLSFEGRSVLGQHAPMHQVVHRLGDKGVIGELDAKQIIAVNL